MAKPLDVEMAALSVAVATPQVDAYTVAASRNAFAGTTDAAPHAASSGVNPPVNAGYDDAASMRHGRVAGRSASLAFRHIVGEELDGDTEGTLGDVLGEMFGIANRHLSRAWYLGLLGMAVLPVAGVIAWKAYQPRKTEGEGR